jgi:hypothetical protein
MPHDFGMEPQVWRTGNGAGGAGANAGFLTAFRSRVRRL